MSIIYLDTSAMLKLYVQETHSEATRLLVEAADRTGAAILAYTEMAAGLSRAARMGLLTNDLARKAWDRFVGDWPDYTRLKVSPAVTERAARLAWEYGLRGYDAVHLAAALTWQDALGEPVLLASFDQLLWGAAKQAGMAAWPEGLVTSAG